MPASSAVSRTAQEYRAAMPADVGAAPRRELGDVTGDEVRSDSSESTSSTRPPGNTCMRGANAIVVARRITNVSMPASPSRRRTTVAADADRVPTPSRRARR